MAADNDAPFAAKGQILAAGLPRHRTAMCPLPRFALSQHHAARSVRARGDVRAQAGHRSENQHRSAPPSSRRRTANRSSSHAQAGRTRDAGLAVCRSHGGVATMRLSMRLMQSIRSDSRERLAALITAPAKYALRTGDRESDLAAIDGRGIVEPAHDWEGHAASHPELLEWLAHDFVVARLRSQASRTVDHDLASFISAKQPARIWRPRRKSGSSMRPERRRLTAEQVVDSLFAVSWAGDATSKRSRSIPTAAARPNTMISLGYPKRAWMFASLSNERDRPSLEPAAARPLRRAGSVRLDRFAAEPTYRSRERPERLAAGRAGEQHGFGVGDACRTGERHRRSGSGSCDSRANSSTRSSCAFLGRTAEPSEKQPFVAALAPGFDGATRCRRRRSSNPRLCRSSRRVTWSNHLVSEANRIKLEMEHRARTGPSGRSAFEVQIGAKSTKMWSGRLINNREFVWLP